MRQRGWARAIAVCCGLGVGACAPPAPKPSPSDAPALPQAPVVEQPSTDATKKYYSKEYEFTSDWFTMRIPVWQQVLAPLKGKPNVHYLEIGTYEGRSAIWVLENILTHPTARMTGIDVFPPGVKERYLANVKLSGHPEKVTTIAGFSQEEVRKLPPSSFDLIYVDGSHAADDVLADAVEAWEVLKPGGILIFDDYAWLGYGSVLPVELRPKLAIDAFLSSHRYSAEVLHQEYQVIVRKAENPCAKPPDPSIYKFFCSPVGPYVYDWSARVLRRQSDGGLVTLGTHERDLLEAFQRSTSYEFKSDVDHVAERQDVKDLLRRLEADRPAGAAK
jgi:predicted O-methyltransferase YrrM